MKYKLGDIVFEGNEKEVLKAEFDKLDTVEQKYKFWKEKFNISYKDRGSLYYLNIKDFIIRPNNEKERKTIDKLIYEECLEIAKNEKDETLEKTKKRFKELLNEYSQNDELIERELKNIDEIVKNKGEYFHIGYENQLIYKRDINWIEEYEFPCGIIEFQKGVEWGKYKEYVKSRTRRKKKKPEIKLDDAQKILLLHHLGFCSDIDDDTIKAKIYKQLIPTLTEDSIRTRFPRIKDYYNKKSKDALIKFYLSINYSEKAYDLMPNWSKINKKK